VLASTQMWSGARIFKAFTAIFSEI
jgi:hypothetical protein